MNRLSFYDRFHRNRSAQEKLIERDNFTYRKSIEILEEYIDPGKRVLDIGSGVGALSLYFASKGVSVTGIDISEKAISIAKKSARQLGLKNKADFLHMVFPRESPSGTYDIVICTEVLEHLIEDVIALKKMNRLVKNKEGILILSVPTTNAPLYRLGLLKSFDKSVGHLRRYDLTEIKQLLTKAGFIVIRSEKTEGVLRNMLFTNKIGGQLIRLLKGNLSKVFSLVDDFSIPLLGESQIYLVARKK